MKNTYPLLLLLLTFYCTSEKASEERTATFRYEVTALDYETEESTVVMDITNGLDRDLGPTGWAIYFNQFASGPAQPEIGAGLKLSRVQGDLWKVEPLAFAGLAAGESINVSWEQNGLMVNQYQLPVGVYMAVDELPVAMSSEVLPVNEELIPAQYRPTVASRWEDNAGIVPLNPEELSPVFPTPQKITKKEGVFTLSAVVFCVSPELTPVLQQFGQWLQSEAGLTDFREGDGCNVQASVDSSLGEEGYKLTVTGEGVQVIGGSPAGVFYGLMSVLSAADIDDLAKKSGRLQVPYMEVVDEPAFAYRGFHLDVSRNFQTTESVKKLLRMMAFNKLNKFHFHLTDDEGWRLEIPELPELTEVGARRGHSVDETDHIRPAYGSGPETDSPTNFGSGFYSQEEMIDILQYAQALHIDVIPEIDLPGHARAAIKAMESRLLASGDGTYRLAEPSDTSKYISAQIYSDNVINVCQQSTYDFVELVVDNLVSIYDRAGAELGIVHIGCDEVPHGSWTASANCQELISQESMLTGTDQLLAYFVARVNEILQSKGLRTAGWEEVVSDSDLGVDADLSIVPYIWHNEELAYGLANTGYDVVLCNAANLYFDLAYNPDPAEPGLKWAGFVDTKSSFTFSPYHIGQSLQLDAASVDQSILTTNGRQNIMGIQGQLWSETVRGSAAMEYLIMPKMLGLAERAWVGDPNWENEANMNADWSAFVHQLGYRELPRMSSLLGGWNYRVPLPGLKTENETVTANVRFPGLPIHYTTDGTDPSPQSQRYDGPLPYSPQLRFRVIADAQHMSRVVKP